MNIWAFNMASHIKVSSKPNAVQLLRHITCQAH
jgi:hypothetical protein